MMAGVSAEKSLSDSNLTVDGLVGGIHTEQYYHRCPWSKNLPSRRMKTHQSLTSSVCVLAPVPLIYIAPLLYDFPLFLSISFMHFSLVVPSC